MKFKEIARNLRNEGKKFVWGKKRLISNPIEVLSTGVYSYLEGEAPPIAYCALGIKAAEFGVPNVTLAYYDWANSNSDRVRRYSSFPNLIEVTSINDRKTDRELVCAALDELEGEADVEGFIDYLKTLTPQAIEWAKERGYNSLLNFS